LASKYLCPDCGQEIEKDWKACPFCGVQFDDPDDDEDEEETGSTDDVLGNDAETTVSSSDNHASPADQKENELDTTDNFFEDFINDNPEDLEVPEFFEDQNAETAASVSTETEPVTDTKIKEEKAPTAEPAPAAPKSKKQNKEVKQDEEIKQDEEVSQSEDEVSIETWHYDDTDQTDKAEEPAPKTSKLNRFFNKNKKEQKAAVKEDRPKNAYNPNYDHYYDDIKPLIDDAIVHVPKENIMKILGGTALLFVIIVYLIFYLQF